MIHADVARILYSAIKRMMLMKKDALGPLKIASVSANMIENVQDKKLKRNPRLAAFARQT